MNKKQQFISKLSLTGILLLLTLCFGLKAQDSLQARTSYDGTKPHRPEHYGIVYLYPHSNWGPNMGAEVEAALFQAKNRGVTTIIQTFPAALMGTPQADAWLIFLDAAAAAQIDVIAYLWPSTSYPVVDGPFNYENLKSFIDVVGNHPALIGYVGLHEPLDPNFKISASELRGFYDEMKSYAPHLLLAHFLDDMAYAEDYRSDGWTFSDGMCDLCIIWQYPFEHVGGQPVFNHEEVRQVTEANIKLIAERDPDAQVWFLGQTFTVSEAFPRRLRMPTAPEMEALYLVVMEYPMHGFFWYPWSHSKSYVQVLGDAEMVEQQEMVGTIGNRYVKRFVELYFPAVIYEYDY